jgi:threonine dehydrogenase-like Zn-dependent dehydrogenase
MRAVRVGAPGAVAVTEVPEPAPGDGEVLLRVAYAGICPTDRRLAARGAQPPRIPGHEVAGHLPDGRPAGVHPDIGCGRCAACRAGWDNRCPDRVAVGLGRDGGLARFVAVPAAHAVPLNGVDVSVAPLLEPLACALHAVDLLGVAAGEGALVVGAGAMGVLCTWALRAAGARVVVSQRSAARRDLAARLGADATVAAGEDPAAALGAAPSVAVVTAPGPDPIGYALGAVATGGRVHVFAGTPGGAPVDANPVHYRHLTLIGSTGSRLADYRRAVDLAARGTIDLAALPCITVPLDRAPQALAEPSQHALKVLVRLEEAPG